MSDMDWALQEAIFAELSGNSAIEALLGSPIRLYDAVPRQAEFPYAVLGESGVHDASTTTDRATEHRVTLSIWSRQGGHREVKQIASALRDALDGVELTIPGFVDLRFLSAEFSRDKDGESWNGSVQFRALIEG